MKTDNPYVGPRAFEEEDSRNFFGRKEETRQLASLVIAHRVVLLYAPSGAGKTSLLRAGLIPYLKQRKSVNILPIARVGGDLPPDMEGTQVQNIYVFNTLLDLAGEETQPDVLVDLSLSEGLAAYFGSRSDQRHPYPCLLILDQFEEFFTTHTERYPERADFFLQLQHSLQEYPQMGLLFSMREDYIAQLDSYAAQLPDRLRTRFRLELLGEETARLAVQEPARQENLDFTDEAAKHLVNDLRKVQVQQPDGTTREQLGRHIEPVQLQVVCRRLWEKLPSDAVQIDEADVEAVGDVNTALADYYADRVKTTAESTGIRERTIREWFDRQLITEQGIRGQVLRGPEQSQGLENRAISPLVDTHLVRAEKRLNAIWYELSHDRLIEPVQRNNATWFQAHLSPLQRQADLWESQSRSSGLLLRDEALVDAEIWAKSHDDELISIERDFLSVCRKVRTRAQKERRKNFFIRWLAIVAVIISIVAFYFFFQAEVGRKEAERQSRISLAQALTFQAINQHEQYRQDERAALLARQAYLFNEQNQGHVLGQVDQALRTVLSTPDFSHILRAHEEDDIYTLAFSPNSQFLASGGSKGSIVLWNRMNLQAPPIILDGDADWVSSIAFSPDGKTLASAENEDSEDSPISGTIRLWDPINPRTEPIVLNGHKDLVRAIAFSPDGKILASGSNDSTVRLWELTSLTAKSHILQHEAEVLSVAFSPDGKTLASGSKDGIVRLWDLTDPVALPHTLNGHEGWVRSVTFSPDGKTLASGSDDDTIRLWDLTNPSAAPSILRHGSSVYSVAFSPDGQLLASGSADKIVRLWNLRPSPASLDEFRGHVRPVYSVAFSPDGQLLASSSYDGIVRLWDLTEPVFKPNLLRHTTYIYSVKISPDRQLLASGSEDNTIRLWDLTKPKADSEPIFLNGHNDKVWSVAFSPNGQLLASGSEDKSVRLWDLTKPKLDTESIVLNGHDERVFSVAFSPDGQTLASGSSDNTVRLWDLTTPDVVSTVLRGHNAEVWSVAFSPDGQTLASASKDRTIQLWDLTNRNIVSSPLKGHEKDVNTVAFSPDGHFLASGSDDNTVRLWNLTTPTVAPTVFRGHEKAVMSVAFSPDGHFLASGSKDSTIRVWDLMNLSAEPAILSAHEEGVTSVTFSSDDQTLISGSEDMTILFWMWRTDSLAQKVCQKVWRNLSKEEWYRFVGTTISYEPTCPDLHSPGFIE